MQKITLTERRVSVTVITVNPTKILGIKRGEQMKLSTRAIYGLRAMIDLGVYSEQEAVSIQSIAGRQNISVSYLEQLMAKLKAPEAHAEATAWEDRQRRFLLGIF